MRWCSGAIRRQLLAASGRIWKRAPVKSAFSRSMRRETRKRATEPCRCWRCLSLLKLRGSKKFQPTTALRQSNKHREGSDSDHHNEADRARGSGCMASPHATDFADRTLPQFERVNGGAVRISSFCKRTVCQLRPGRGVVEQPAIAALVSKSLRYSREPERCRSRMCREGRPLGRFWGRQSESSRPGRVDGSASAVCR